MTETTIDTLGDALPREMARVRDQVLPTYLELRGMPIVGALDGLLSLIARIEAKGEVSHWVEILPALRDAVAILRRMGSRFEPTAEKSNESVELWMPRAQTAAYGLVYLPGYAANFKHEVVQKVVDAARREGFCGTAAKRLEELGWEIVKLVAKPVSENDR